MAVFVYREPVPRSSSIIMMPSRILVADLSLNEIQSIDYQSFEALWNLRSLDVSLNRVESYVYEYNFTLNSHFIFRVVAESDSELKTKVANNGAGLLAE